MSTQNPPQQSWYVQCLSRLWVYFLRILGFSSETTFKDFMKTLLIAISVAVAVRSLIVEPFKIPSGSMHPTLIEGDFLLVNKWAYGYSRYSFPFGIKFFEGRIGFREPQRGDVVVFKPPHRPDEYFIKRLVGLPGDRIQMKEGVLHINDQPVRMTKLAPYRLDMWHDLEGPREVDHYEETFPNLQSHKIVHEGALGAHWLDNTDVFSVPEGHYFMVGDNRCHSGDSRILEGLGFVPAEHLVGKASLVFFSTDAHLWQVWRWLSAIRYQRLLRWIQ